ncbi:3100_t:CDS:2, partial [Ambispora leptoticha]
PKRTKGFKWTVNIEHATLEALKNSIRAVYQTPALEMMERCSTCFKFIVFIETPSKPFAEWTFPKICQLYGLGETDDPSLSACLKTIPISGNEASKSQYVCPYLIASANLFEG